MSTAFGFWLAQMENDTANHYRQIAEQRARDRRHTELLAALAEADERATEEQELARNEGFAKGKIWGAIGATSAVERQAHALCASTRQLVTRFNRVSTEMKRAIERLTKGHHPAFRNRIEIENGIDAMIRGTDDVVSLLPDHWVQDPKPPLTKIGSAEDAEASIQNTMEDFHQFAMTQQASAMFVAKAKFHFWRSELAQIAPWHVYLDSQRAKKIADDPTCASPADDHEIIAAENVPIEHAVATAILDGKVDHPRDLPPSYLRTRIFTGEDDSSPQPLPGIPDSNDEYRQVVADYIADRNH